MITSIFKISDMSHKVTVMSGYMQWRIQEGGGVRGFKHPSDVCFACQ